MDEGAEAGLPEGLQVRRPRTACRFLAPPAKPFGVNPRVKAAGERMEGEREALKLFYPPERCDDDLKHFFHKFCALFFCFLYFMLLQCRINYYLI